MNFPRKLVRLITPPDAGTFQGQDGQVYPMAEDRSIEVPTDYVPGLLARGYVLGGKPDAASAAADPSGYDPTAIAKLRAPAACGSLGAGGRMYTVGPDGTVDVQVQDVAQLIDAGCSYYIAPRAS